MQGGIHVYYMLRAYVTSWPTLLFGLLTLLAAAFGHGGKYLMKDLGDMSKMPLSHYFSAHLSVLYATILPIFMAVRKQIRLQSHVSVYFYSKPSNLFSRLPSVGACTASPASGLTFPSSTSG